MNLFSMPFLSDPHRRRRRALRPSRIAGVVAGVTLLCCCCAGGIAHPLQAQANCFAADPLPAFQSPAGQKFKVGDAVEAYDIGWYRGRVVEIGTGKEYTGHYLIDYDDYATNKWHSARHVRAVQTVKVVPPAVQKFKVGDAVEAYNIGWYKGRVVELGTGKKNTGDYLVDFDDYSIDQWFDAKNVRAIQVSKVYSGPPRAGRYLVMGFGNPSNPLHLGYFVLKGGNEYRFYTMGDKLIGAGGYRFDPASKIVTWLSGPFKKNKWEGKFEITREGKTHTIRLNRATIGTNSTDK